MLLHFKQVISIKGHVFGESLRAGAGSVFTACIGFAIARPVLDICMLLQHECTEVKYDEQKTSIDMSSLHDCVCVCFD